MIDRSEEEIMKNWQGDSEWPVVSICTITYNHERYIEEALDSFLMQETDFPFEIVIDDDASTDNTPNIIRKYAKKYPRIIKANLRKENVGSLKNFCSNLERASGRYIAICEGDDYWIDNQKLQKQFGIFENNKDITIVFHPALEKNYLNNRSNIICNHFSSNTKVPLKDIIINRGGYMPTASIMIKNINFTILKQILIRAPIADFFLQVYYSYIGKAYFINDTMCVYRRNHYGSWTNKHNNKQKFTEYSYNMIISIDKFYPLVGYNNVLYDVLLFYTKIYIINNKMKNILSIINETHNVKKIKFLKDIYLIVIKLYLKKLKGIFNDFI